MSTDLDASYKGVYENRIGFGRRPALLLVDFVQAYFEPACDLTLGSRTLSPLQFACGMLRARRACR